MALFSVIIAVSLLYFALRNLDWSVFLNTLKNARLIYLPVIFLWSSISFLIRAVRLSVLLNGAGGASISGVFMANMAGYLGNNLLPARAGEIIRATYLAKQNNIAISYALAIGFVERLMDLIALIVLGSFALSSLEITPPVFQHALKGVYIFGLIGLGAGFALPYFQSLVERVIMDFPFLKEGHKIKLDQFLRQFLLGLKSLQDFKRIVQFIGLTCLVWLWDAVGMVFLAYILRIPLLLQQALILLAALGLSSAIPSTPGYVGVYQFVAVTILAPFGVSRPDALAYILGSQIIGYIVVGFWGVLSLWKFNRYIPV